MEKNNTSLTTQNTQITATPAPTTLREWFSVALPMPMLEAIEMQKKQPRTDIGDLPLRAISLAVVAHKVKSLDAVGLLPPPLRPNAISHLSLRTMFELLEEGISGGRAEILRLQYNVGVDTLVDNLALQYFGARLVSSPQDADGQILRNGIAEAIRRDYAMLSPAEITEAFAVMSKNEDIKAYGKLTVQFLHSILGAYKSARNRALNVMLDKEAAIQNNLTQLEIIAKNDAAFEAAKSELADLALCNKKHKSFYTCPAHFVRRFVEEGLIEFDAQAKLEFLREAKAYLANDIVVDAPNLTHRKIAIAFVQKLGITQKVSPRDAGTSDLVKSMNIAGFDYTAPTQKQFNELANDYYAKMLYFQSIAPHEDVLKLQSQIEKTKQDANTNPPA